MSSLTDIFAGIDPRHRAVLQWFEVHAGHEVPWPQPLTVNGEEIHISGRAKGIFKPAWTNFAVSVREGINSEYNDSPVYEYENGTWLYMYHQEGHGAESRDSLATNRGLMACSVAGIPVGVFQQVKAKPNPRYLIRGLAFVGSWNEDFFFLEGGTGAPAQIAEWQPENWVEQRISIIDSLIYDADLDPSLITDERIRRLAESVIRPGQNKFRRQLLTAYRGVCAFTGCDTEQVLQAAHISPFMGQRSDTISNGLLLRADLHLLFDDHLITIDEDKSTVLVAPSLRLSQYGAAHGQSLVIPSHAKIRPSRAAIVAHRERCGF